MVVTGSAEIQSYTEGNGIEKEEMPEKKVLPMHEEKGHFERITRPCRRGPALTVPRKLGHLRSGGGIKLLENLPR